METEQKVIVEPAGKTEADWSSAPRSSTELPEFVEGEFSHMINPQLGPPTLADAEAAAEAPQADENAATAELRAHMTALMEAGGKARDSRTAAEDSSGLIKRIASRLPGN